MAVDASHAVMGACEFAIGINHTDRRLSPDVAIDPYNAETRVLAREWIIRCHAFSRRLIVGEESPDGIMSYLAGEPDAIQGIGDVAGEKQVEGRLKKVCVLKKKGPLLREEDREPLIHRHLRLVGFHLAEVGIDGRVQHQAVFQHRLAVEPCLRIEAARDEPWIIGVARIQGAVRAFKGVRNKLHIVSPGYRVQAFQRGLLAQASLNASGNARPRVRAIVARDPANEKNSPCLLLSCREAQTLERNRLPNDKAAPGPLAFRFPYRVE